MLPIFHFLFYFLWGLNYHRTPLQEKLIIDSTYTVKDLKEISKQLIINQTNYIDKYHQMTRPKQKFLTILQKSTKWLPMVIITLAC